VLPSPQRQNIPNCVSEYAKQDKNMPNFFRNKNTWKIGNRNFSYLYEVYCTINDSYEHSLSLSLKKSFPSKESDTMMSVLSLGQNLSLG